MFPYDETAMPWRSWTPTDAVGHLADLPVRWAVAGGWAIDLHAGRPTRSHADLEIAVPLAEVGSVLAAFDGPDWQWYVPHDGHLQHLTAAAPAQPGSNQTWLWSRERQAFVMDVFREEHDGDTWICRRDRSLRRPWSDVVTDSPDGVPHLVPEVVLLFKAKRVAERDIADLLTALPGMDGAARAWLRTAVARVHPGHAWLDLVPDPITVRPGRAEDTDLLETIFVEPGRRLARQAAGESSVLVAWLDGIPVGTAEILWVGGKAPEVEAALPGCPELNGLDVRPARLRSRGIGTAILAAAEALVRERGLPEIGLGVDDVNTRAARLYLRLGYQETGLRFVDRYDYADAAGVRHEVAAPARFLTKPLAEPPG